MTQTSRSTATHLTSAVVSAATGVLLSAPYQVLALVNDLSGGTIPPDGFDDAHERIRAELIRQVPWLAQVRLPDFNDPDTTTGKNAVISALADTYGGIIEIECGTLAPRLGVPANAKIARNL